MKSGSIDIEISERGDSITVQEIRKHLNLSPVELAKLLGLGRTTYFQRQNGNKPWLITELIALAKLIKWRSLEIDVDGECYRITIRKARKYK